MSFNTNTERLIELAGVFLQIGTKAFTTSGLTCEVDVKMRTRIIAGGGVTQDSTAVYQDGVITSGKVTFTRVSGGTSGASFDYWIMGY